MELIKPLQEYLNDKAKGLRPRDAFVRYPNKVSYSHFKKMYPNSTLTRSQYKAIIMSHVDKVKRDMLVKRDGVEITGFGLCIIVNKDARKNTGKNLSFINIKASVKYNKLIPNLLLKSGGKVPVSIYTNKSPKYRIKNKRMYLFDFYRPFRREVFRKFCENPGKYLKIHKKSVTEVARIMDSKFKFIDEN